ncbi:MAG: 3-ketoacyl-ACP reductase [Rhodospirillales bacterium]|jgi:3-oxoacyl-[acyl-carrier protein] reductase|nr:3-ketoacyl-ACP reductase [Rhodospirillales bacterium]
MAAQRKVALITGGRRGIGFGIAKSLAAENCDIVICDIVEENEVQPALKELADLGAQTLYVKADISVEEDRARMVDTIHERFGRLNVLVNNAGVGPISRDDILEATEESFERVMGINLRGPYFLTQRVANYMAEQKKADDGFEGSIVFITSVSSTVASISRGEYCMSKAGLTMAVKLFAVRMAEYGIPVYEIRPGVIATELTAVVKDKYDKMFAEGLALQPRWGFPEDIGKAVAGLVRGDLAYSTGQVIMIDGGMQIQTL